MNADHYIKPLTLSTCIECGRVLDGPGICELCAERVREVPCVIIVRHSIPEHAMIEPSDLLEHAV